MKKHPYSPAEVYHLLGPSPVVLVTSSLDEMNNIMTMTWHTIMNLPLPLLGL